MKLMTKDLEKKFKDYPLHSQEDQGGDAKVVAKYFNPLGDQTWYILEGEKLADGDWEFFGYCCLNYDEFGTVYLSDLENIKLPFGMSIERDNYLREGISLYEVLKIEKREIPEHLKPTEKVNIITHNEEEESITYKIYQIKNDSDEAIRYMFTDFRTLQRLNLCIDGNNYEKVYEGKVKPVTENHIYILDDLYKTFNINHPSDYRARSLSVSDIVVLNKQGKESAYFCDSFGWKELGQYSQKHGIEKLCVRELAKGIYINGEKYALYFDSEEAGGDFLKWHNFYASSVDDPQKTCLLQVVKDQFSNLDTFSIKNMSNTEKYREWTDLYTVMPSKEERDSIKKILKEWTDEMVSKENENGKEEEEEEEEM